MMQPSKFLRSGLRNLNLIQYQKQMQPAASMANELHHSLCPGHSRITMAAVTYLRLVPDADVRRDQKAICKAFNCSEQALRDRIKLIRNNLWDANSRRSNVREAKTKR